MKAGCLLDVRSVCVTTAYPNTSHTPMHDMPNACCCCPSDDEDLLDQQQAALEEAARQLDTAEGVRYWTDFLKVGSSLVAWALLDTEASPAVSDSSLQQLFVPAGCPYLSVCILQCSAVIKVSWYIQSSYHIPIACTTCNMQHMLHVLPGTYTFILYGL